MASENRSTSFLSAHPGNWVSSREQSWMTIRWSGVKASLYLLLYGEHVLGGVGWGGGLAWHRASFPLRSLLRHRKTILFVRHQHLWSALSSLCCCAKLQQNQPKNFPNGWERCTLFHFVKTLVNTMKRGNGFVIIIVVFLAFFYSSLVSKNIHLMICSGNSGVYCALSKYHQDRKCVCKIEFTSAV